MEAPQQERVVVAEVRWLRVLLERQPLVVALAGQVRLLQVFLELLILVAVVEEEGAPILQVRIEVAAVREVPVW